MSFHNTASYLLTFIVVINPHSFLIQILLHQAHTWFLRFALSANVGMRVCVCVHS